VLVLVVNVAVYAWALRRRSGLAARRKL